MRKRRLAATFVQRSLRWRWAENNPEIGEMFVISPTNESAEFTVLAAVRLTAAGQPC